MSVFLKESAMAADEKKKQEEAIKAAMMEELGITRMDKLPMEDRPKHGLEAPGPRIVPPGSVPSQRARPRNSLAATWHNAIASGKFQDDDAAAVKNLDSIGGGQLHRLGRAGAQVFYEAPAPQKRVTQTPLPQGPAQKPTQKPTQKPLSPQAVPRTPQQKPVQHTSEDGVRRIQGGKYGIVTVPDGKELKFKLDMNGNIPPSARSIPPKTKDVGLHQMDMSVFGDGPLPLTMDDYIRMYKERVEVAAQEQKAAEMAARAQGSRPTSATKGQQPQSKEQPRSQPQPKVAAPQGMQKVRDLIDLGQRDKVSLTAPDRARVIAQFEIDVMPVGPRRALPSIVYVCTADPPTYGTVVVLVSCGDVDDIEYPVAHLAECCHTDVELLCRWNVGESDAVTHCFIFKNLKEIAQFVKAVNALKKKVNSSLSQGQQMADVQTTGHMSTTAHPVLSRSDSVKPMETPAQVSRQVKPASGIDQLEMLAETSSTTTPATTVPAASQPAVGPRLPPGLSPPLEFSVPHGLGTSQAAPSGLGLTVPPGFGFPSSLSTVSGYGTTLPAIAALSGLDAPPRLVVPPELGFLPSPGTPSVLGHAGTPSADPETAGPRPVEKPSSVTASEGQTTLQSKPTISESQHYSFAAVLNELDPILREEGFEMTPSLVKSLVYELLLQSSPAFRSLDTKTRKQAVETYCTSELLKTPRTTYSLAESLDLRECAKPPPDWLSRIPFLPRRTSARKSSIVTTETGSSSTGVSGYVPKGVRAAQSAAASRKELDFGATANEKPSSGQQHTARHVKGNSEELLRKQIDDIAKHIRSIHLTAPAEHWAKPAGNAPSVTPKQELISLDDTEPGQTDIVNPSAVQSTTGASGPQPLLPWPNGAVSGRLTSTESDLVGINFNTEPVDNAVAGGAPPTGIVSNVENSSSQQPDVDLEIASQSSAPSNQRAVQRGLKASRFNVPDSAAEPDGFFSSTTPTNSNW